MSSDKTLVGKEQNRRAVTERTARKGDEFQTCGLIF